MLVCTRWKCSRKQTWPDGQTCAAFYSSGLFFFAKFMLFCSVQQWPAASYSSQETFDYCLIRRFCLMRGSEEISACICQWCTFFETFMFNLPGKHRSTMRRNHQTWFTTFSFQRKSINSRCVKDCWVFSWCTDYRFINSQFLVSFPFLDKALLRIFFNCL